MRGAKGGTCLSVRTFFFLRCQSRSLAGPAAEAYWRNADGAAAATSLSRDALKRSHIRCATVRLASHRQQTNTHTHTNGISVQCCTVQHTIATTRQTEIDELSAACLSVTNDLGVDDR